MYEEGTSSGPALVARADFFVTDPVVSDPAGETRLLRHYARIAALKGARRLEFLAANVGLLDKLGRAFGRQELGLRDADSNEPIRYVKGAAEKIRNQETTGVVVSINLYPEAAVQTPQPPPERAYKPGELKDAVLQLNDDLAHVGVNLHEYITPLQSTILRNMSAELTNVQIGERTGHAEHEVQHEYSRIIDRARVRLGIPPELIRHPTGELLERPVADNVGTRLEGRRKELGISLEEHAANSNVSEMTMRRWYKGPNNGGVLPTKQKFDAMLNALGISDEEKDRWRAEYRAELDNLAADGVGPRQRSPEPPPVSIGPHTAGEITDVLRKRAGIITDDLAAAADLPIIVLRRFFRDVELPASIPMPMPDREIFDKLAPHLQLSQATIKLLRHMLQEEQLPRRRRPI